MNYWDFSIIWWEKTNFYWEAISGCDDCSWGFVSAKDRSISWVGCSIQWDIDTFSSVPCSCGQLPVRVAATWYQFPDWVKQGF